MGIPSAPCSPYDGLNTKVRESELQFLGQPDLSHRCDEPSVVRDKFCRLPGYVGREDVAGKTLRQFGRCHLGQNDTFPSAIGIGFSQVCESSRDAEAGIADEV